MRIRYYATLWPLGGDLDARLAAVKAAGFEGFEDWVRPHAELRPVAEKHGLAYRAMVGGDEPDAFRRGLDEAFDCQCTGVTVHAGRPLMRGQEAVDFLGRLVEIATPYPFPVDFETHRGRLLFEPLSTADLLKALPDLWLCADLSHWTVVTESRLGGYVEALNLAISRTRHIHARVGFEEGPQVPDPRVPMWADYVTLHEGWWDKMKEAASARGQAELGVDPEFGPAHYQWTDPATGHRLADPFAVAQWMRDRLQKRWA